MIFRRRDRPDRARWSAATTVAGRDRRIGRATVADPTTGREAQNTARYEVGYVVGSLSSTSINRELSQVLIRLAPEDLEFTEIPIGNLPLYSQDYDANYPPEATALKDAIRGPTPSCSSPRSTTGRSPAR